MDNMKVCDSAADFRGRKITVLIWTFIYGLVLIEQPALSYTVAASNQQFIKGHFSRQV